LDCFAGSGTTAAAAETCGRRWIVIDNSETAIDTMIERIHRLPNPKSFVLYNAIVP
jgi:DNA modification methylase